MIKTPRRASRRKVKRGRPARPKVLATAYFRLTDEGVWFIRGSGAMYGGPSGIPMHPNLRAVLDALEADNISVKGMTTGSPVNCDSYTSDAQFDDGGLSVETGNYWWSERGGSISGTDALSRLIRLLDLRVTPQTARAWGLSSMQAPPVPAPVLRLPPR